MTKFVHRVRTVTTAAAMLRARRHAMTKCLDLLGMKIGDTADWKELSRIARENIILKDRLSQVCGDCKWSHICRDKADKMKSLH